MGKLIAGLAVVGVAASIALLAQNQLKTETGAETAGPSPRTSQAAAAEPAALRGTSAPIAIPLPMPIPAPADSQLSSTSILKRASRAYGNVKTLKANFTQTRENPILGSSTSARGVLYQKRPDRFLMKFSEPAGDVILSDGRYFWLYYPSADRKQVLRAEATTGAAGGVDLQAQFLGDPIRRFTYKYHGIQTVNGRPAHVLTLTPRQRMGYRSLKVWIDTKDALVRRFILTENNGVVLEINLSDLIVNRPLSNDLFHFVPPADAKIIERI